jgi:hypothetical protein
MKIELPLPCPLDPFPEESTRRVGLLLQDEGRAARIAGMSNHAPAFKEIGWGFSWELGWRRADKELRARRRGLA